MKTKEPQIWYRVWNGSIQKVLVSSATDKTVKRPNIATREAIDSEYVHYRRTFEQAKLVLLQDATDRRNETLADYQRAERDYARAEAYSERSVQDYTNEFTL